MNQQEIKSHIWITYQGAEGVRVKIAHNSYADIESRVDCNKFIEANTFPILNTTEIGLEIHGEDLELVTQVLEEESGDWIDADFDKYNYTDTRQALRYTPKQTPKADSEKAIDQTTLNEYIDLVNKFGNTMIKELVANNHKGGRDGVDGWLKCKPEYFIDELDYHVAKLNEVIGSTNDADLIIEYTADIANLSMMVQDIYGQIAIEPTPLSKVDIHFGDEFAEKFIRDNILHGKTAEYVRMAISTYRTQHPDPAMVAELNKYKTLYEELDAIVEPLQDRVILLEAERGAMVDRILEYVSHNISEIFMKADTLAGQKRAIKSMRDDILKGLSK